MRASTLWENAGAQGGMRASIILRAMGRSKLTPSSFGLNTVASEPVLLLL